MSYRELAARAASGAGRLRKMYRTTVVSFIVSCTFLTLAIILTVTRYFHREISLTALVIYIASYQIMIGASVAMLLTAMADLTEKIAELMKIRQDCLDLAKKEGDFLA